MQHFSIVNEKDKGNRGVTPFFGSYNHKKQADNEFIEIIEEVSYYA